MLMPAAVLIVLVLAAMAIDLAHLQLGQRQLRSMAADAANDAAGAGVDVEALRAGQPVQLDPALAEAVARRTAAAQWPSSVTPGTVAVTVDPAAGTVTVAVSGTVAPIVARALPGHTDGSDVQASATATLRDR